uniref:Uncharacterized protein n=1 Tax=Lactuca sativa TaxID=4236 RepID=A0A9R1X287_LACSA|nr:hypothetical protein LSAT_V11C800398170 [Lactuca sativa]
MDLHLILKSRISMMKRKHQWHDSLQKKPLYEEFMLLKKMMTCHQLKPFLHHWRLTSNLLDKRYIAKLPDDNKALDGLTKSKEAALLDAERTV